MKSIEQRINEYLADRDKDHTPSGKFTPSNFGRCFRMQYWKRKGEKVTNPPDERAMRVFACGHLFEEFVTKIFAPETKQSEIETEHFKGFADVNPDDDTVVEIKSVHSRAFWYMQKTDYDVATEKLGNILQLMFYVKMLDKQIGHLVYVSKDDLCIAEYKFDITEWEPILHKEIQTLLKIWKDDTLPPPKPRAYGVDKRSGKPKECQFCGFKDKCYELEGGEPWKTNSA